VSPSSQAAQTPEPPIIDGWMFNPLLQYVPNRWNILAMERLRQYRIGPWQPRFYTVPVDVTVAINAGTTLSQNILMQPGTEVVALNFAILTAGSVSDLLYRLRDPSTEYTEDVDGYNFTDGNNKFISCNAIVPSGSGNVFASGGTGTGLSGMRTCLLSIPYKVKTGTITVELTNKNTATNYKCQLLLYCMEPFTEQGVS
jgi:hypothetical protein